MGGGLEYLGGGASKDLSYNRDHRFERLLISSFREDVGAHELRTDQVHRHDQLQDCVLDKACSSLEVPCCAARFYNSTKCELAIGKPLVPFPCGGKPHASRTRRWSRLSRRRALLLTMRRPSLATHPWISSSESHHPEFRGWLLETTLRGLMGYQAG